MTALLSENSTKPRRARLGTIAVAWRTVSGCNGTKYK